MRIVIAVNMGPVSLIYSMFRLRYRIPRSTPRFRHGVCVVVCVDSIAWWIDPYCSIKSYPRRFQSIRILRISLPSDDVILVRWLFNPRRWMSVAAEPSSKLGGRLHRWCPSATNFAPLIDSHIRSHITYQCNININTWSLPIYNYDFVVIIARKRRKLRLARGWNNWSIKRQNTLRGRTPLIRQILVHCFKNGSTIISIMVWIYYVGIKLLHYLSPLHTSSVCWHMGIARLWQRETTLEKKV